MTKPAKPLAVPPVAVPAWPGPRYADLIQSGLHELDASRLDSILCALARAMDRYLAAMPRGGGHAADAELDSALDEALHLLTPAMHASPDRRTSRAGT
ncbi:MAG TPA: hypothetical protein VGD42_21505 [Lysobacter sp.]